jgi:hypothetical protein
MELFNSIGGNNRPDFQYRFAVKDITPSMFDWCSNYPDGSRPFRRFHILWKNFDNQKDNIVQFEWEEPAITFALTFGEYII